MTEDRQDGIVSTELRSVSPLQRLGLVRGNQRSPEAMDRLASLYEANRRMNCASGLDEVLTTVVEAAVDITRAEGGALMLLDSRTQELCVRAQKGLSESIARSPRAKVKGNLAEEVVQAGKPLRLTSQDRVLRLTNGYMVNAILYVPVMQEARVIGVLYVGNQAPGRNFTVDDERMLSALADDAVIAIKNARRVQLLSSLHETGRSISSVLALEDVLNQIAKSALDVLDADMVVLYEYDEDENDITTVPPIIQGNVQYPRFLGEREKVVKDKQSAVFNVVRLGQPFYASDAQVEWARAGLGSSPRRPGGQTFLEREEIISSAGVPLVTDKETVGVMFVNYRSQHAFTDQEKETVELFATQAAIAIQNARLVKDKDERIEKLAELVSISRAMTERPVGLSHVLQRTVENARKVMEADYALVFLYDKESKEFQADPVTSGIPAQLLPTINKPRPDGITRRVIDEAIVDISDVKNTKKYPFVGRDSQVFFNQAGVQSLVGVRLQVGQEIVGVLYTDFCASQRFSNDDLRKLQLLTNQAAIAIQNARRVDRLQRQARELGVLNEIGQEIGSDATLRVEEILQLVYEQTTRLMEANNFYVAFYDEERETVSFPFVIEQGEKLHRREREWVDRTGGRGMTEYVIRSSRPLLVPKGVSEWVEAEESVDVIGRPCKSWLGAPMIIGDRVLGVIGVQNCDTENKYDQGHEAILSTIASYAGIAIKNAQLLQERKKRLDELTDLHEVSLEITRQLEDPESLLRDIVGRAARLLEASGGGVLLRKDDDRAVTMQYTHKLDSLLGFEFEFGEGAAGWVAESGEPLTIQNYYTWDGRDSRLDEETYGHLFRSLVLAPLKWQDEVMGVLLVVDTTGDRFFTKADVHLLELFANQAAIAIQNAKLFNQKVRELEALRRADVALLSTMGLGDTLQTILDGLSDLVQYDCALIRLFDEEQRELILEAHSGDFPGEISAQRTYGIGLVGRAAKDREMRLARDVRSEPDYRNWLATARSPEEAAFLRWIRSEVAVPLIAKEKLIGVLAALWHTENAFQDADIRLMKRFAGQAAMALHNAQLIQRSRQHTVLVAHQLRGPVQAIRGDVDYAMKYVNRNYSGDARLDLLHRRVKEHFGRLRKELDNFAFLIRDDLGVGHKYSMSIHPVISVVGKAADQFREIARSRDIEINVHTSVRQLPKVEFDWENMFTVFTNIIENAVKYSHSSHTVDIDAQRHDDRVLIEVADFGLGVMSQDRNRIFELYTQGRLKDEKRFVQGTGIGLWVSREIIKAHGGSLGVWSQLFNRPELVSSDRAADRGFLTVFTVELPVRQIKEANNYG